MNKDDGVEVYIGAQVDTLALESGRHIKTASIFGKNELTILPMPMSMDH